ncbi:hypothetical protein M2140_000162 [Clostridiales Family XIII bacterium PM5-7]
MNDFEKLRSIYNTLLLIETKGQNTILMSACLSSLKEVLDGIVEQAQEAQATE